MTLPTSAFTQDNYFKPRHSIALNDTTGDRLLRQCSRLTPKNTSDFWTPTEKEIQLLEEKFKRVLKLKTFNKQRISNLNKFAFQYLGVTIDGKRFIYVNAFCIGDKNDDSKFQMHEKWKTDPIVMCDGGDCYWGVLFDLDKLKFKDLAINGVI